MSYKIKADTVIFENEYSGNSVTLKHSKTGGTLEFASGIKCTIGADFNSIDIGEYTLKVETSGDLCIKKNDVILLKLNS